MAGFAVVIGPYAGRLLTDLRSAERERIRTEERAEMAAQLHDSVLQTLALMQRAATDPRRMVLLARRQERELRYWLYGGHVAGPARTLAAQAEAMAAELEIDHDVPIELVVVGDHPVDDTTAALLGAVREAAVNAAKHAGADEVAIYIEVGSASLVAFVRTRAGASTRAPSRRTGTGSTPRSALGWSGAEGAPDWRPLPARARSGSWRFRCDRPAQGVRGRRSRASLPRRCAGGAGNCRGDRG